MPYLKPSHAGAWLAPLLALAFALSGGAAMARPQVIKTHFPTKDIVIATAVVQAPRDGATDATGAIQAAINEVAGSGGGVLFLPEGRYRLEGHLLLKEGVTLRGDWPAPREQASGRIVKDARVEGTILMPVADRGKVDGPPAIAMERGTGLRELSIWYPDQKADAIVPYPWTVANSPTALGDNTTLLNVTLVNPYQGVKIGPEWNELHTLRNVYGSPLKTGIWIDSTTDIGRLTNVDLRSYWWERSGLPGAPDTAAQMLPLIRWMLREGTAIDMGRSDWEYLYQVRADGYATGYRVHAGKQGTTNAVMFGCELTNCGTALRIDELNGVGLAVTGGRLTGSEHALYAPASFRTEAQLNSVELGSAFGSAVLLEGSGTLTFQNCRFETWHGAAVEAQAGRVSILGCSTPQAVAPALGAPTATSVHVRLGERVQRARLLGNEFAGGLKLENGAERADVQVAAAGFRFARPDTSPLPAPPEPRPAGAGLFVVSDYGAAPAQADNTAAFAKALDAARKAGGGTVYVPAGNYRFAANITVPSGVELRGIFDVPHHTVSGGSVLMPTAGRGQENGTPFIRLEQGSGVRGITVWYPEQNLLQPQPYPWAVQSLGPRCWVVDTTLGNAYQGVDFWTHPSDGHVIRYLAGGLLKRGVFVSKCAGDGWVEDVMFNPHYTVRIHASLPHPAYQGDVGGAVIAYQHANLEGIVFGRCEREHVRGTFLYASFDGIAFRNDGGGANARVIEHGTDASSRCVVLQAAGSRGIEFIDAQLVPLGRQQVGAVITEDAFAGKASFFNTQIWGGNTSGILSGKGEVLLQQVNTLIGGFTFMGGRCTLQNGVFARDLKPHVTVAAGCAGAAFVGNVAPEAFQIENGAGGRLYARANAFSLRPFSRRATPGAGAGGGEPTHFRTGWEAGEPQGLADEVAQQGGGMKSVSGPQCHPVEGNAHSGQRALRVAGKADDPAYSYCYFRALAQRIGITPDSALSYWIRPGNERGRCVGVDLLFSDGSTLRDSGAQTTDGLGVHPGQEKGKVGEWSQVTIPLGQSCAGKVVAAILFAYDSRGGGGPFEALVDDLALEPSAGDVAAQVSLKPHGGVVPLGTRVEITAPTDRALRYTLDGTNPVAGSPRYETPIVLDKPGLAEVRVALESADGQVGRRVFGELYEVKGPVKPERKP